MVILLLMSCSVTEPKSNSKITFQVLIVAPEVLCFPFKGSEVRCVCPKQELFVAVAAEGSQV